MRTPTASSTKTGSSTAQTTTSSPFSARLFFKLVVPIVLAMCAHRFFSGRHLSPPPPDFGSGHMFDMIATRYDWINRVLALGMDVGWRRRMARVIRDSLQPQQEPNSESSSSSSSSSSPRPRLLDLATGTADVALLLRQEIPTAIVLGVDPSSNMLQVGQRKIQNAGYAHDTTNGGSGDSSISLQQADAQDLIRQAGLELSSFDAATMAFGIRNVPDRNKALCQIHAVLKPNACFSILEFSEPDDSFGTLGLLARWFIRFVVPTVGGILSGAPREYWHLQNSIQDFPAPQDFVKQMENLDCSGEIHVNAATSSSDTNTGRPTSGSFRLEELIQMNFGSVQLYVMKALKPSLERQVDHDSFQ